MRLQRLARDERGTVAVITAGLAAALVGCLVLTADFGSLYLQRRQM
jgi:Flp pilus assembly protein TadG